MKQIKMKPHFSSRLANCNIDFWGVRENSEDEFFKEFYGENFHFLKQIHSAIVIKKDEVPTSNDIFLCEGDAIITREGPAAIRVADCIPILFASNQSKLFGGIHAGWRGLKQNIIRETVNLLLRQGQDIQSFEFFIGPHIGPASYEVSSNVYGQFADQFARPHNNGEKRYLNLLDIAKAQFEELGVSKIKIQSEDTLTSSYLYSHRGGDTERNVAVISKR